MKLLCNPSPFLNFKSNKMDRQEYLQTLNAALTGLLSNKAYGALTAEQIAYSAITTANAVKKKLVDREIDI